MTAVKCPHCGKCFIEYGVVECPFCGKDFRLGNSKEYDLPEGFDELFGGFNKGGQ
jgi:endogenous inhibitor of DNA gyrase (YacG/DUF329 family)